MSGVDQRHAMALGVKNGSRQGHEPVRDAGLGDQGVEVGDSGGEVRLRQDAEAGVGAQLGHEQGRRHALAGHVAQQDGQALPRQRDEVVIIAADFEGRLVVGEKLVAGDLRQPPR